MKGSEEAFSQHAEEEGQSQGKAASGQLNVAVIALKGAQQQMCQGSNPSGQPKPNPNGRQQVQSLTGQQNDLNQDTQSLVQRLTQQERLATGDQNTMEQLAARQEAIRRGLEEAQKSQQEGDLLGRLDEAKRDMEEVAKKLQEGRLDTDLTERQNRILSRLLDAQRSVNRREFDDQRESRTGEDAARPSPPPLARALLEPKARAERDLLRARAERYPAEYRDLVESYLRRLQESH
jgi:cation diffusion facilitator CzcD-associated flavoprotein CzcO